jgi:hypothetical protein
VEHLPWRFAAIGGLIVGAVCVVAGIDLWVALARVGLAFAGFGLGGFALRVLLTRDETRPQTGKPGQAPGAHIDQTTPPMSVEDVSRSANAPSRRRDENET